MKEDPKCECQSNCEHKVMEETKGLARIVIYMTHKPGECLNLNNRELRYMRREDEKLYTCRDCYKIDDVLVNK